MHLSVDQFEMADLLMPVMLARPQIFQKVNPCSQPAPRLEMLVSEASLRARQAPSGKVYKVVMFACIMKTDTAQACDHEMCSSTTTEEAVLTLRKYKDRAAGSD